MTRKEALGLVTYAAQKWGAAAALPTDPGLLAVRVEVWMDALADLDVRVVRAVLAEAGDEFPPNPAVIRERAQRLRGVAADVPTWDEFWAWVRTEASQCSRYLYGDRPAFACPWPSMEGLLTVGQVEQWALDGIVARDLEMVVQAHMRRLFEARVGRLKLLIGADMPIVAGVQAELDLISDLAGRFKEAQRELES